jgi:hypothetical protein
MAKRAKRATRQVMAIAGKPTAAQLRKAVAKAVAEVMSPSKFEQLQMRMIELAGRLHSVEQRLGELTIPSEAEVQELKARFRAAMVYVDQVKVQVSSLADARNITAAEYVTRSTFFAWKEAIDERLRELERDRATV